MKRESDDEALLKDVFGEAAPASLREAMLGESLRVIRRRRGTRRLGRAAAFVVVLGLAAVLIRQSVPRRPDILSKASPAAIQKSYALVRTQPLLASAIVTTRPLSFGQLAGTMAAPRIVQTRLNGFRLINDEELLSLISPRPCALIQIGPNSKKLVFLNPDDAKGFPAN